MIHKPFLVSVLFALTTSFMAAEERTSYVHNKRSEVKASDFALVALDVQVGALYFTIDGTNLYYKPDADSTSLRISTITGILDELRHAHSVVVTYYDGAVDAPEQYPGGIYFPAYAPLKDGTFYRPVGGFWLTYRRGHD